MLIKLLPAETQIRFMHRAPMAAILSVLLVIGSLVLVSVRGLNFGIDFQGGIVVEIDTPDVAPDIARARAALQPLRIGDLQVQEIADSPIPGQDTKPALMIRSEIPSVSDGEKEQAVQDTTRAILEALRAEFGTISVRRSEAVGPKVSAELLRDGLTALALALGLMLIYIWLRFEWQFSLGAVLALVHDVILTIGMFALTRFEFNLSTVAALLTIIGYSMNDTVVVYDRVREELRRYRKLPLAEVVDLALNRTLSRTLLTSGTTLLALLAIFLFGGAILRGFSFAMIWGVLIGTWSSIFIASSLLLHTGLQQHREGNANPDLEPDQQA